MTIIESKHVYQLLAFFFIALLLLWSQQVNHDNIQPSRSAPRPAAKQYGTGVTTHSEIHSEIRFLAIGDWGSGNGELHEQKLVAQSLTTFADTFAPHSVLSMGDNIYSFGVSSTKDPQFADKFENVYTSKSLQIPWLMTLGNHDCNGNIDAEVEYTKQSNKWYMPARYYSKDYKIGKGLDEETVIRVLVLDACALTCALTTNYRCEGMNMSGISKDYVTKQLQWVEEMLSKPAKWKIVVGHFPIFSFLGNGPTSQMIEFVLPLLLKYSVDLYLNGHDHNLQHVKLAAPQTQRLNFFVCGGGGYKLHGILKPAAEGSLNSPAVSLFNKTSFGFASLVVNQQGINMNFWDTQGTKLYEYSIRD
eukprot:m.56696 g.56696  ORF g.56696 m.56696 type:complete len:361 (-) comp11056_c0_seq1:920-2002(-)